VSFTNVQMLNPSGDTSGATDVSNVNSILSSSQDVILAPGTFYGNAPVNIGANQKVTSIAGRILTTWKNVSSGPAFKAQNSGSYSSASVTLSGIWIDGSGAGSGASGFQLGDYVQITVKDMAVSDFTGGNIGAHLLNAYWWTEQATVECFINNCDTGLKLDQSGAGTNSYDRCVLDLLFNQQAGQNGVVFGGATQGVVLLEGVLRMHGNWANGTSPVSSSVLSFTTEGALIQSSRIEIGLEIDGNDAYAPKTISFKDGSTTINRSYGHIEFYAAPNGFAASNNNNNIWFDGPIVGDNTLLVNAAAAPVTTNISPTPSGWDGTLLLMAPHGNGLLFGNITMSVPNGTVVTSGETVATGLPNWAIPGDSRFIPVSYGTSGGQGSFKITSGGALLYSGPTFTASGTVYLYGQSFYWNGQDG
jgi:hypothetical protein